MTCDKLSSNFKHGVFSINIGHGPKSYEDASEYFHWREAMNNENVTLENNNTWIPTNMP